MDVILEQTLNLTSLYFASYFLYMFKSGIYDMYISVCINVKFKEKQTIVKLHHVVTWLSFFFNCAYLICVSWNRHGHKCPSSEGTCLRSTEPCVWTCLHPVWFGGCQCTPPWDSLWLLFAISSMPSIPIWFQTWVGWDRGQLYTRLLDRHN